MKKTTTMMMKINPKRRRKGKQPKRKVKSKKRPSKPKLSNSLRNQSHLLLTRVTSSRRKRRDH
jgi:hypothetical protein